MNCNRVSALVIATGLLAGFSSVAHANCLDSYNFKYGTGPEHKAFAMTAAGSALSSGYKGAAFSCSWSVNQPTRAIAVRLALAQCESIRVRNDRRGACRIAQSK